MEALRLISVATRAAEILSEVRTAAHRARLIAAYVEFFRIESHLRLRITVVRKLAVAAADCGLLAPDLPVQQ
jgi:hypothetical protein